MLVELAAQEELMNKRKKEMPLVSPLLMRVLEWSTIRPGSPPFANQKLFVMARDRPAPPLVVADKTRCRSSGAAPVQRDTFGYFPVVNPATSTPPIWHAPSLV
jgi:hypothetical protein